MFRSILFGDTPPALDVDSRPEPAPFRDLNLDQVTGSVTAGLDGYHLKPFFYTPLSELDLVQYRHEVFRDLDDTALLEQVGVFAAAMRRMREHLATAQKLHYPLQQERWFLEAVAAYCEATAGLARYLDSAGITSRGFLGLREHLAGYKCAKHIEFLDILPRNASGKLLKPVLRRPYWRGRDRSILARPRHGIPMYSSICRSS